MASVRKTVEELRADIFKLEAELQDLRQDLAEAEAKEQDNSRERHDGGSWKWPLREEEYERYGRQLVLPGFGVKGQLNLKSSSVLVIGAGGLGCPAALYLAGAGVGTIGIVDGDLIEASNLHRQIAHSSNYVGLSKTESVIASMRRLNPLPQYREHPTHLTPANAEEIVAQYDVVLDCTDHPTSRYLISDICVLLRKPLVSASALRTDGQLIVLNCPAGPQGASGGPCYRCVFPKPPPADSVVSCGEGGILGPVVGVMGVMQALEAIKIIVSGNHLPSAYTLVVTPPSLLLFSSPATNSSRFTSVRMRGRKPECFACSAVSALTLDTLRSGSLDYVQFCGGDAAPIRVLDPEERISPAEYNRQVLHRKHNTADRQESQLLLDVREKEHFELGSIPGAVNVPYSTIQSRRSADAASSEDSEREAVRPAWIPPGLAKNAPIYVVCRVGNDSQEVVQELKDLGFAEDGARVVADIKGGMRAWKRDIDPTMPFA